MNNRNRVFGRVLTLPLYSIFVMAVAIAGLIGLFVVLALLIRSRVKQLSGLDESQQLTRDCLDSDGQLIKAIQEQTRVQQLSNELLERLLDSRQLTD